MAKHGLSEKRLVTLGKQLIRNRIIQTQAVFASRPKKEWTGEEEQRLRKLAKRRRTASGMSDDDTQLVSHTVLHCEQTSSKKHKSWLAWVCACCVVLCCAVLCCAVLCCAVLCCAVLCCAVLCCAVLCHQLQWQHSLHGSSSGPEAKIPPPCTSARMSDGYHQAI